MYGPFLCEKSLFKKKFLHDTFLNSQFVLLHASDNTTSRNIEETNAWAVPISNFGETVPPVTLSLRPWLQVNRSKN